MSSGRAHGSNCFHLADEMATILDMSREFGYHVAAFHHAVEAYKIADLLAEHGVCAAMWADWWGRRRPALRSRHGSIARGRPADLVLWSGDPLEVTTLAERVFIEGQSQPMQSRQTLLRDRYLEKLRVHAAR